MLYQHVNCIDTAIMPVRVIHIPCGLKVKVKWFNVSNPENPWYLGLTETIFIKKEQVKNWIQWSKDGKAKN